MLVLDSEALSAAAHGPAPRGRKVALAIGEALAREEPVVTSAAVLAEVVRGRTQDAAVYSLLRRHRIAVADVDTPIATRAGELLESIGSGSERAVDAFLVAMADQDDPARIVTGDLRDMRMLAAHCENVSVTGLS